MRPPNTRNTAGKGFPVTSASGNDARESRLVKSITAALPVLLEASVFALILLFINWIQSSCWHVNLFSFKAFFYIFLYLPIIVLITSAVVGAMAALYIRLTSASRQRPKLGDVLIHVYVYPLPESEPSELKMHFEAILTTVTLIALPYYLVGLVASTLNPQTSPRLPVSQAISASLGMITYISFYLAKARHLSEDWLKGGATGEPDSWQWISILISLTGFLILTHTACPAKIYWEVPASLWPATTFHTLVAVLKSPSTAPPGWLQVHKALYIAAALTFVTGIAIDIIIHCWHP